ncbi:hypothetical protein Sjap_004881 [Stephania japonica]|uniref:CDT1 Geminin-binding domain-containing protein n=1 Tax=Stephania japonica TaxID=461633 RepID=A0AAP0K4J2_9MAGN
MVTKHNSNTFLQKKIKIITQTCGKKHVGCSLLNPRDAGSEGGKSDVSPFHVGRAIPSRDAGSEGGKSDVSPIHVGRALPSPAISPLQPYSPSIKPTELSPRHLSPTLHTADPTKMKPIPSPLRSFKSKKIVQSSPNSSADPNTPEKPLQPPQRLRNRSAALSLKDVRTAALGLRRSGRVSSLDPPESTVSQGDGSRSSSNLAAKSRKPPIRLPEKYEILGEFFDRMESSIRLLQAKRRTRTFTNISKGVECMMDRRFTHTHLAQMKHILPEVIEIEKVLSCDEQTLCMKPDLQITLQGDALESKVEEKKGSGYTDLRKVFRSRLSEFYKAHPEVDDVPEEPLPEPFNQSKQNVSMSTNPTSMLSLPAASSSDTLNVDNGIVAGHLSRSFVRRFVGKVPIPESKKSQLLATTCQPSSSSIAILESGSSNGNSSSSVISHIEPSSKLPIIQSQPSSDESFVERCPLSSDGNGVDTVGQMEKKHSFRMEIDQHQVTPAKNILTPARLMTSTPDLQTPKRSCISHDDDIAVSPDKLLRRPPAIRTLLFPTPVKNNKAKDEMNNQGRLSSDADIVKLLPESLLQSIREKERKATEGFDIAISQAKRRRQMIASLPKLFNMIHLIFQSTNRYVLTKEELIHKTIASHCDIVDRNEIEEQFKLLLELVPDWISEKVGFSGDVLLSVNKTSSPDLIRRTLAEAL